MKSKITPLFDENKERVNDYSFQLGNLYVDFSKTHICDSSLQRYIKKAEALKFKDTRNALFSGEPINMTEGRSVLHTLLRETTHNSVEFCNEEDRVLAMKAQKDFFDSIDLIRSNYLKAKEPINNIIHIGIGGSSLGPQLLFEALSGLDESIRVHFVDNIDGHQIISILNQCDPKSTLVFGVSKTFTTQETLVNIGTVQSWYEESKVANFSNHFFAVTADEENAKEFGIDPEMIVVFPQWVGGRYSIWSSVSLSVGVLLGSKKFHDFLMGAALVDKQFLASDYHENPAFIAAVIDHMYVNEYEADSKATFAYDYRLRTLVPYLQQLETESNGKDRDINGEHVKCKTSPVVWGGTGTGMQHSTFQLLHQGTHVIPVEFILVKTPDHDLENHHKKLISNGLAQSAALLRGRSLDEVSGMLENENTSTAIKKSKVFSGEKPSTTIVLTSLSPSTLGQLLAFYEHRTFCGGLLSNINSYDQMGVELGKHLANSIEDLLEQTGANSPNDERLDESTRELLSLVSQ